MKNPTDSFDKLFINEIVEGTMINLFYDHEAKLWEIATKSAVGGNYWYYRNQYLMDKSAKQPTFRQMFMEAIGLSDSEVSLDFGENMNKKWSYTFVLQHPANHIVLNITKPRLYLVSVYEILPDTSEVKFVSPLEYETSQVFKELGIEFPKRYNCNFSKQCSIKELEDTYCSIHSPNQMVGLMFTNLETGERAALENPTYSELRELRGNNPNLQYQYLCLKSMGKVDDFLRAFPQYKAIFWKFYTEYTKYVTNLHQSYMAYYIKKTESKISKQYFPLAYKLHHQVYLPSLSTSGEKVIIKRKVVLDFLNKLPPGELIYYLNYQITKDDSKV
jgi:hypothetical protein